MNRAHMTVPFFVTLNALLLLASAVGQDKVESSAKPMNQASGKGSAGGAVDRRETLKSSDDQAAHWQAGDVQRDGQWLAPDQLKEPTKREREYEQMRSKMDDDIEGHRKLARWCHRNQLTAQARAHWNAIIEKSPNDLEARRQLGHQWIEDDWFDEQEIRAAAKTSREIIADLKRWNGQVSNLLKSLTKGDSSEKQAAIRKLAQMDDPSCVASLELAALQTQEDVAKLLIDRISQHRSRAACLALTRIALADPHSARGAHAIKSLKEYDQTLIVPDLLGLLSTSIETRVKYGVNQRGELVLNRILFRETKERRELIQLERVVRTNEVGGHIKTKVYRSPAPPLGSISGTRVRGGASGISQTLVDEQAGASMALDDQARFERELAEANRRQEARSKIVRYLLSEITGKPAQMSVEEWWKWWQGRNYRSTTQPKPTESRRYQQVDQSQLTVNSYENHIRNLDIKEPLYVPDCLVAGTLVQTSTGNRPIESLHRGDLVLSQNVETGQLDLKPILRVVPREPGTIIVVRTDGDEIRSTQGHRWWVSGQGWVMAADLQAGMNLHTATGTIHIKEVREDAEQPTFNLVVDEYHTYFVGKDRVLSFDNVEPVPTLRKVPGY